MKIDLREFQPIVDECKGCERTMDDEELGFERCTTYIRPSYWWENGRKCPLSSRDRVSHQDVVKLALKEGIVNKDGEFFIYNRQGLASSINGLIGLFKRNRGLYSEIKKRLGLETESEEGKVRVGQQKQKKKHRR